MSLFSATEVEGPWPVIPQVRAYQYAYTDYRPEVSYKLVGNDWSIGENIKSIPSEVRQRLRLFGCL